MPNIKPVSDLRNYTDVLKEPSIPYKKRTWGIWNPYNG